MSRLYKQVLFLSSYTIKWIKIRHFISFYNSRSLLLVTMLAHRNQIANLIRSSSALGNEVVDGCLFEQKYLATLSADTTGLCMDYAFYVSLFLLLSPHMFSPHVICDNIVISVIYLFHHSFNYDVFITTFFPEKAMPNLIISFTPSSSIS